jgi:spore germination protein GerM
MKYPRKEHVLVFVLLVALTVFGVLVGRKYWFGAPPAPSETAAVEEPSVIREVRLYFGSADAMYLVAETRELKDCPDDQACLQKTVQALVEGPKSDLVPIMPPRTRIRNITEQGGVASIDFSREFVAGHPGGSVSELLTVYGLSDTLADNFPHVRKVRILVEGQPVSTLKGHVDLSRPIAADFRFVRRAEARSDAEAVAAEEVAEAASAADRQEGTGLDDPEVPVEEGVQ